MRNYCSINFYSNTPRNNIWMFSHCLSVSCTFYSIITPIYFCRAYASVKGNLELPLLKGRRRSWGVYFQGLVNLDLINFLTMWIFTLCKFRPCESWTNAVYISSENVLNTKIDCSKNVLLIVVLEEYKLKWMCC